MQRSFASRLAILSLFAATPLFAATHPAKAKAKPAKTPKARAVVTHATVTVDGKSIPYTATAGTPTPHNKNPPPPATFFSAPYTKAG